MSKLDHPFIVSMLRSFESKHHYYIVMLNAEHGDLFRLIRQRSKLCRRRSSRILLQVYLAINHLHRQDIIYRDLKPENVLIGEYERIQLTDFGLSRQILRGGAKASTLCGTPEYLSPEMIENRGYGLEVDIWALGVLYFELLRGTAPFSDSDPFNLFEKILHLAI